MSTTFQQQPFALNAQNMVFNNDLPESPLSTPPKQSSDYDSNSGGLGMTSKNDVSVWTYCLNPNFDI